MSDVYLWSYILGLGQGGTNIAKEFVEKLAPRMGYVDYDTRNFYRNMYVDSIISDKQGAGGDSRKGAIYFEEKKEIVRKHLLENIQTERDKLLVIAGGGNGSGDGSIIPCIELCKEINIKPYIILTFPFDNDGLKLKQSALERAVEIINNFYNDIEGFLVVDNQSVANNLRLKDITGYAEINNYILNNFLNYVRIATSKDIKFVETYKIFDFNDFLSILSNSKVMGFYEIYGDKIDTEQIKKELIKSNKFTNNMNLSSMRSGICVVEVPTNSTFQEKKIIIDLTYKGLIDKFKLSERFIFTAIETNKNIVKVNIFVTGMTLINKVQTEANKLKLNANKLIKKSNYQKIEVDLNLGF